MRDDTVAAFLEERLRRSRYAAIGEFHLYGADADLPVPRRMIALAREHKLVLHAHSDVDAIERIYRQDPAARMLWAHSGFDRPDAVRDMLRKHKNLWCDLAFRTEHGGGGKVPAEWRALFTEFPDRFMVGTDTFTPERWHYIVEHANWSRAWLADLPPPLAERIGWRNGEALFSFWKPPPSRNDPRRRGAVAAMCGGARTRAATPGDKLANGAHYTIAFKTAPAPIATASTSRSTSRCARSARRPCRARCASTRACPSIGTA